MGRLKVVSLFAGIGGICLGFKQAGCEIVWANEIDKAACKTYKHNLGDTYLVEDDIRNISPDTIPDFDILTAGFPCQPFSIVGKQKGFNDDRGMLFFQIERIIETKRPKIVFLENVANLIDHNDGKSFMTVFNSLAQFGYSVRYSTLSPHEYVNIPQKRNRVFIIAFLDNDQCNRFNYPQQTALTKLVDDIIDISLKHDDVYYYKEQDLHYKQLTNIVKKKGKIYKIEDAGVRKYAYSICPTLTANMGTFRDRVPIIRDNFGIRKITPRDCLDLQGFPSDYNFPRGTSFDQAYKQIGNSVCVPIIKMLAEKIKDSYIE